MAYLLEVFTGAELQQYTAPYATSAPCPDLQALLQVPWPAELINHAPMMGVKGPNQDPVEEVLALYR